MQISKYNLFLFFLIIFTINACKTKQRTTPIKKSPYAFDFVVSDNLNTVLDLAKSKQKLIYLDVSASWCAPCQLMKRDVYTHQETADFFNKNFVNYLVDGEIDEGPDLKLIFGVTNYPTLLILDSRGRVVHRKEGGTFHDALIQFGQEGLNKNPSM